MALGIRKARKPRIHQPNAVGPADWITAALVMNNTIAAKIATMSNELRTLGRIPPATRSESSSPLWAGSTAAILFLLQLSPDTREALVEVARPAGIVASRQDRD
jgi:hypothetical protein